MQLALLNAAGFVRGAGDATMGRLVAAIEALDTRPGDWGINSCITDALKHFGALENEGETSRDEIRAEVMSALDDEGAFDLALSVCVRMFDHPFDAIYIQEIDAIGLERRRALFRRALRASDIRGSLSLSWLVREIVELDSPADAPLISPMAQPPDHQNMFPQEQWGAFVLAARYLGRHGLPLPLAQAVTHADKCVLAIRTVLHAAEAHGRNDRAAADAAWIELHALPPEAAIDCLAEVEAALADEHWGEDKRPYPRLSLLDVYPQQCLTLARRFIGEGAPPPERSKASFHRSGPPRAFEVIGKLGDRSDLACLRALSQDHPFAANALAAISQLDGFG